MRKKLKEEGGNDLESTLTGKNSTGASDGAFSNECTSTHKTKYSKRKFAHKQNKNNNQQNKAHRPKNNCEYSENKNKSKSLNSLRCLFFNATSIGSGHKWRLFRRFVASENHPHVIGIVETWFNYKSLKNLKNYTRFDKDRVEVKGGGVALYFRNDVRAYVVKEKIFNETKSEQVWANVKIGKEDILISSSYRPPGSSREVTNNILENIVKAKRLIDKNKYSGMLCMGDFNYDDVVWDDEGGVCRAKGKKASLEMLEIIGADYLIQHVHEPTFGTNTLDLIFTENPNRIFDIKVGPPFNSTDKNKLHLTLSFEYNLASLDNVKFSSNKFIFNRGDYIGLNAEKIDWELDGLSVNEMYEKFLEKYNTLIKKFIPISKSSNKFSGKKTSPPWFTKELKILTDRKKSMWCKVIISPKNQVIRQAYKEASKEVDTNTIKCIKAYEKELAKKSKTNPKLLYAYVNEQSKCKDIIRSIIRNDGETTVNPQEIANCLNDYFFEVFEKDDLEWQFPIIETVMELPFVIELNFFTLEEVYKNLTNLDQCKSMGVDSVHPHVLKECANKFALPLSIIFTESIQSGYIPDKWKMANISPIFKKGSRVQRGNYRGISLTSVPCKLMEKSVKKIMVEHLIKNSLINEQQHGFVKLKSCVTNLLECLDIITQALNCGHSIDLIFLDFAKAFDKVWHRGLLLKLKTLGFNGKILDWIESFLSNRTQRVTLENVARNGREYLVEFHKGLFLDHYYL